MDTAKSVISFQRGRNPKKFISENEHGNRGLSGLRLSEFVQISEFFSIYITDIFQTSELFSKNVNLK